MKSVIPVIILAATFSFCMETSAREYSVVSPSGRTAATIFVDDADGALSYQVSHDGTCVVAPSALGLKVNTATLNSISGEPVAEQGSNDETYILPHGKYAEYHDTYNEIIISGGRREVAVRIRAYDDGIAFRYELAYRQGNRITADLSEVNIAGFETAWAQRYHKDYSWYYEPRDWSAMRAEEAFNMPLLIKHDTNDLYTLFTEAASTSAMAAGRVKANDTEGSLALAFPADSEIREQSFVSPWRTLIIGTLPEIVESTLVANLNPPTDMEDLSWIKPGRVAWNWGAEDGDSAPTPEIARKYIDFASAMGWEYFLLDDGWDGRVDLAETVAYAEERNVGLLIWVHQNRFLNDYGHIRGIFHDWAALGVKGVKIDFFEDDRQEMLTKYEKMLQAAAETGLMVNFHGCTKPSGLERTWPHLMTSEAVLGGEFYMFNTTMTPGSHTVNLVLTRNVLGGMDYTPVKFGNKRGRMITDTTWAYQLALATAFESSLQSICDTPGNILGSMAEPLLRRLPVAWDETRCLEGKPDEYVTLARRSGDDWWVATITSSSREISIPIDFIGDDEPRFAHIYSEGFHRSDIAYQCREVRKGDVIHLAAGKDSGATVILTREVSFPRPFSIKLEAEKYNRLCQRVEDPSCSGGAWLDGLGGMRKMIHIPEVEAPAGGVYNMTLFYISKGERDAYIRVNGGEMIYHHFADTGGRTYFVTVPVALEEGSNEICIGNESGSAPGFDRLVISRIVDDEPGESSVETLTAEDICAISAGAGQITVTTPVSATVTIYRFDGTVIQSVDINAGTTAVDMDFREGCIVNVSGASLSVSKKIIIK